MKKILFLILIIALLFVVGCQKSVKKEIACTQEAFQCPDGSYVQRTGSNCDFAPCPNTPIVGATGDAAVDAVGNGLNNVDSVDKDLNSDDLSQLDSGFTDVENI